MAGYVAIGPLLFKWIPAFCRKRKILPAWLSFVYWMEGNLDMYWENLKQLSHWVQLLNHWINGPCLNCLHFRTNPCVLIVEFTEEEHSPGARPGYGRSRVCQMDEYSFRLRWYSSLPLWIILCKMKVPIASNNNQQKNFWRTLVLPWGYLLVLFSRLTSV